MITELVHKGFEKIEAHNKSKREKELQKREIPTGKNFFWLMDQLRNIDGYGTPTEFIVQNPNYFVEVSCLAYVQKNWGWVTDKQIKVHQPGDVKDTEVVTRFFLHQKHSDPDDSQIDVATALFDVSTGKYKSISPVSYGVIDRFPRGKQKELSGDYGVLTREEQVKIIGSAYRIAYQAIIKRSLPHKVEPLSVGVIQLPFQPRLI